MFSPDPPFPFGAMGLSGCRCFLIRRRLRHRRRRRRVVISLVDVGQVDAVRGRGLDVSPGALLEDIRHVDLRGLGGSVTRGPPESQILDG